MLSRPRDRSRSPGERGSRLTASRHRWPRPAKSEPPPSGDHTGAEAPRASDGLVGAALQVGQREAVAVSGVHGDGGRPRRPCGRTRSCRLRCRRASVVLRGCVGRGEHARQDKTRSRAITAASTYRVPAPRSADPGSGDRCENVQQFSVSHVRNVGSCSTCRNFLEPFTNRSEALDRIAFQVSGNSRHPGVLHALDGVFASLHRSGLHLARCLRRRQAFARRRLGRERQRRLRRAWQPGRRRPVRLRDGHRHRDHPAALGLR